MHKAIPKDNRRAAEQRLSMMTYAKMNKCDISTIQKHNALLLIRRTYVSVSMRCDGGFFPYLKNRI